MPRDEGFAVADTATDKLDDPKFRRLWRTLQDVPAMNAAVVLHEAVQLKSWLVGERVTADDAAPFWMLDVAETTAHLQSVGLLDRAGKLPVKAWDSWIGPARARRQRSRDNGTLGGRPKKPQDTDPKPTANPQVSESEPAGEPRKTYDQPSVRPSVQPTDATIPAHEGSDDPEWPVIVWLAQQNAHIVPTGGRLHQRVMRLVDKHTAPTVIKAMAALGEGLEANQYILGADNALNPIPSARPDPEKAKADAEEAARVAYDKRVEKTRRELAALRGDAA